MVTGKPSMIVNSSMKSWLCIGTIFASAARRPFLVVGDDHLAHRDDAVGVEEHMLGAAQADAFRAEFPRRRGVQRRFGVGAHFHPPQARRPSP